MHIQQRLMCMITHLPAAPPCLVLGPNSYIVKCVYPFTRIYTHACTVVIAVYENIMYLLHHNVTEKPKLHTSS